MKQGFDVPSQHAAAYRSEENQLKGALMLPLHPKNGTAPRYRRQLPLDGLLDSTNAPAFCIWLFTRPLHSKHSLQNTEHLHQRVTGQNTQALDQPISIDGPELINNHIAILIFKVAAYAKRVWMPTRC
jgi:hypothetical protein